MKQIRSSKFSKFLAYYLAIMMFIQVTQPMQMYALTSGPTQPEFNAFTPIGTSDMVDLTSGDFNYNIPIMDVGGYPLNLAYNSGVTMDQEASWVGLGWNLNVGQIERQVRGLPDDFNGDKVIYENGLRDNVTVGMNLGANLAVFGFDGLSLGAGLGVETNNYEGISFKPSFGVGFQLSDNVSVGMNLSSSVDEGATVTPSVSISKKVSSTSNATTSLSSSISLGLSSRKGVENLNISAGASVKSGSFKSSEARKKATGQDTYQGSGGGAGIGGSISFNDQSYTPSKRIGFENSNFTFNAAVGGEIFGGEGQAQITGYGSYQKIHPDYKNRAESAFGYEYTHHKRTQSGVLDFNRDNEQTVSQNTLALPITNYTYDLYSIDGQGVSGMFRPFRSQVSNLHNDYVVDFGSGKTFGVEIGLGNLVHGSGDFRTTPSVSHTGPWSGGNNVLPYFTESSNDVNSLKYESSTFKLVGGLTIDPEQSIYNNEIHETKALKFAITGFNKNGSTAPYFFHKDNVSPYLIDKKIKRTKRFLRNQVIQKVTSKEADGDAFVTKNNFAIDKNSHTAGIKILQTDGSTYVFGKTAYNTKKVEATFDISQKKHRDSIKSGNRTGLIGYTSELDRTVKGYTNSSNISDQYLNKITTPKYAHSYMLTSVLSTDYEDVDGNGPTLNDLGTYTQFDYKITNTNYKWRVPFKKNVATYNNGLISKDYDQKANYIYGEKELVYLDKIVTKTHVAFFDLEDRKDAIGVNGENGGTGDGRMQRIKSIRLYSRPEVTVAGIITDPGENGVIKPIKKAHFEYDYSLCPNIPNNTGTSENLNGQNLNVNKGKLTLKRVYFTYRNSNMGKYTPYIFDYGLNPDYDTKGFDIWGNYKQNLGDGLLDSPANNTEFPFVKQDKITADNNIKAWTLNSVQLPSGGEISVETESDDYQFVQNKKAMQMFQVLGCGNNNNPTSVTNTNLYFGNNHQKYLYVKISDEDVSANYSGPLKQKFIDDYLSENYDKAIQFRFLLNMRDDTAKQYEYVNGYFEIEEKFGHLINVFSVPASGGTIVAIPMKFLKRDGGTNGGAPVNPIAKTGWGFGRTYLNRLVYGMNDNPTERDFETIVNSLAGSIDQISTIFTGPNLALQSKGCARNFKSNKSWVRLETPNKRKLGGGLRVKSIKLSDNWSDMLGTGASSSGTNTQYGQEYSYDDDNGNSSGVATFEPNASSENPLVEPFYSKSGSYAERIAAPRENNYVEKPFGADFFPSPKVTYSKVTVKNYYPTSTTDKVLKKHASGKVVTRHYTSYEFPTQVEHTNITVMPDITPNNIIGSLIANGNVNIRNHVTMSQGYSIVTNDMNGKVKSQEVYAERNDADNFPEQPISKVEYKYNIDEQGNIDNNMLTIDSKGKLEKKLIGLDYDMINDFNESYSKTAVSGVDVNLASFMAGIFPIFIPTVFPKNSSHENLLRTAVTTKHIHKTGILVEKIATDLGSTVSTKNLAWDAESGQVLLTETVNEYDDHYYSFSYPAYWMYKGMGLASNNIGIQGDLTAFAVAMPNNGPRVSPNPYFKINGQSDLTEIFHVGDELFTSVFVQGGGFIGQEVDFESEVTTTGSKMWVVGFNNNKSGILLMDRNGNYVNKCRDFTVLDFKIVRSGYRNLQSASMASITSMTNPLKDLDLDLYFDFNAFLFDGSSINPRIVNASAVVYKEFWRPEVESGMKNYPEYDTSLIYDIILPNGVTVQKDVNSVNQEGLPIYPYGPLMNPFVMNIKGDWRAEKSYAYLTGRNSGDGTVNNPRNEGFYNNFSPFYQFDNTLQKWGVNENNWTYASSITKYSHFGVELENKDAINRYSTAQYGYKYTLPTAVVSNSKYSQMGNENFESDNPHFNFLGDPNVEYSNNQSHTGHKSIKVLNETHTTLSRNLFPTDDIYVRLNDCPSENSSNVCELATINWVNHSYSGNSYGNVTFQYDIQSFVVENSQQTQNFNIGLNSKTLSFSFSSGDGFGTYVNVNLSNGDCVSLWCRANDGGSDSVICSGACN
jgi:hypothetical protein